MIDISKLKNVRKSESKTTAQCPACAELGLDKGGDHLIIRKNGKFACVVNPGMAGSSHRSRIYLLVGEQPKNKPAPMFGVYRERDRICL